MFPTSNQQVKGDPAQRSSTGRMGVVPGGGGHPPPQHQKKRRRRRRDGEEEEPVLRTTCDNCTSAKVKCNGAIPCVRCTNKGISCEYTYKKRCGPKRRKGKEGEGGRASSDTEGLLASYRPGGRSGGRGGGLFDETLGSMSVVIGKEETECVRVFMQNVNAFTPLTTLDTVKQAADPIGRGDASQQPHSEEVDQKNHARKAVLHGAIAVGAEFLDKEEASQSHALIARQEIKECFDAAEPELVGAYLILALYWMHQMDSNKIARYIGFAHQSNGIIAKPPPELVASLTFISVVLYDAKVVSSVGCRVDPPGPALSPSARASPVASQERVLKILSFVLLAIRNRADPTTDPSLSTGEWDPVALARHVDNAKALLDGASGPNDMARCVVVVLQAYFLLLRDDRRRAVVITEPLADLVADNPLVLHLPIVWVAIACVRALLSGAVRTIAVERLESAMEPLVAHLAFASEDSVVGKELLRVFGKKRDRGGPPARGVGAGSGVPALSGARLTDSLLLRASRAQTSSLNVTAGDGLRSRPTPADLLSLEASPAPSRRVPPPSALMRHSASMDAAAGSGGGALSSSLLSAAMASSNEGLRASSAPVLRTGSLTRARPFPFERSLERAPASLLQLDTPSFGSDFMGGPIPDPQAPVPGIVPLSRSSDSQARPITEDEVDVEASMGDGQARGHGHVAVEQEVDDEDDEDMLEGIDHKFVAGARDLISRQHMQQSFNANAAVSLEQVESNLTQLSVSSTSEGRPTLGRRVNSLDLEAAADQLLATKSSFIS